LLVGIQAGCQTPALTLPEHFYDPAPSAAAEQRSQVEPPTTVRAAEPELPVSPVVLDQPPQANPATAMAYPVGPTPVIQSVPMEPVVSLFAGKADAQARQDAFSTLALMGATGAIHILKQSAGGSNPSRGAHKLSGDVEDLMQDDDQSSVSKQKRPPFLFTLEQKF
jgi:hypothetical protein